ncbi:FAR1 DNA-binding domain [Sesbania bispinosa]|nr:FAR1 DNA-binding domain [Sesbania bispinosa]
MDDHVSIQGSLQFGTFQSNEVHTGLDVTCSESSSFSDMGNSENECDNEEIETPIIVTKEQDQYEPKIGMIFSNEDEAYKFYNEYAKFIGFTVRRNQYRRLADGTLRQMTFVCGREGHRKPKDPSHVSKINRKETRTGCPTMICFTIEKDTWIVFKFISDHNHDLVNSSARAMLRSQRHVDEAHANIFEVMDNAGIKPCGMAVQAAKVYTHVIFEELYDEMFASLSVAIEKTNENGTLCCYKLVKADGLNTSNNGKPTCEASTQGINLSMSQIMHKAIYFAAKGALTDELRKMANDHLENGLKTLERMLKNIKLGDTLSRKPTNVDDETSDEEKNEHNISNSRKLLDRQRVRAKGTTNARVKSQLEKKRHKASSTREKDLSTTSTPASTFYFSHISQVASASSSQVANKNHISNNILLSFPYTQLSSGSTMGQEKP